MAGPISCISLVILVMFLYYISPSVPISTSQNNYPPGSLACKPYQVTTMDCGHRGLVEVPVLDQNLTLKLDLSHNQLKNITGAPFAKLNVLVALTLGNNKISQMSSTTFRGLQTLECLELHENKLVDLPEDIFSNLFHLTYLGLDNNLFTVIPNQALGPLHSLREMSFINSHCCFAEIHFEGFQNLTNLHELSLLIRQTQSNIRSSVFLPLSNLPIRAFIFQWAFGDDYQPIDKKVFAPLTGIRYLITQYESLPAMNSLQCPSLETLALIIGRYVNVPVIDKTSLQVLEKWNTSLIELRMLLVLLQRVEDHTFTWIPNLLILDLDRNKINFIAKNAFYGLNTLEELILSNNSLTSVPDALEVFRISTSLQHLDLGTNKIIWPLASDTFSAVSNSLTYLNLAISNTFSNIPTNWIGTLQHLSELTLTSSDSQILTSSIKLNMSRPTLQSLTIRYIGTIEFTQPLCTLFPILQVFIATNMILSNMISFLQSLEACINLKELDLSRSIDNFNDLTHLNITISDLHTLKLRQSNLPSIKLLFFINAPNLSILDLADNLITTIDSEIAHRYQGLISLNIQDNQLQSLSGLQNLASLHYLIAASNKITSVPDWLLSKSTNLWILHLSNNPFQCNCKIEPFRKWILSDMQTWLPPDPNMYVCATPDNLKGMSITGVDLDCKPKTALYLSITIPSVLFLCIAINFLFRYRWHIKYKLFLLYRNYHPFPDPDEDFEMLQLQYHAYVAYNENSAADEAWVMNDLQPNMEDGPEPMQLCIKSRDFTPGHFLLDSIDQSIHQSHKTILVLSPSFVESEWCYQEMQMAQMRLLDDNLDVLVLVLLNDIPENKITLSLRQILCRKEYLKWPKDRAGQRLFWQRLREELKAPVQVDRCFQL